MANCFITREEACSVLQELIDSDILNEDLEGALQDIIYCIEEEQVGYHCWGANAEEFGELHIAYREDLWTDKLKEKMQAIHNKHSFKPAPYEEEYFKKKFEEIREGYDGDDEE